LLNFAWHHFLTGILGLLALFWVVAAVRTGLGMLRLPRLAAVRPLADAALPSVSILFSARNEAEKMPAALRSMLAQDYPHYQVVAVNDRSNDATPEILDEFARACKLLVPLRVLELPPGWLGKPHGLQQAYEHSSGEWLIFTDADVIYEPDVLRRAVSLAIEKGWDHLTLLVRMEMVGFWEKTLLTFFAVAGILYAQPWNVPNPRRRSYAGMGAFQLLRRSAYQSIGTHQRLAMEVIEDMKLGKLVKDAGYISGVAWPARSLRVRWHSGLGNLIRGTEKNFFAASGFSLPIVSAQVLAILLFFVAPFLALPFTSGLAQVLAGVAVIAALTIHAGLAMASRVSPLYALMHPFGALIFAFMVARSAFLTLRQGGIYWRDTFYPLEQLRRGLV
jgi:glycosyltransferase involved in cell wall biosynthesis